MANIQELCNINGFQALYNKDSCRYTFKNLQNITKSNAREIWGILDKANLLATFKEEFPNIFRIMYYNAFGVYYQDSKNTPTK